MLGKRGAVHGTLAPELTIGNNVALTVQLILLSKCIINKHGSTTRGIPPRSSLGPEHHQSMDNAPQSTPPKEAAMDATTRERVAIRQFRSVLYTEEACHQQDLSLTVSRISLNALRRESLGDLALLLTRCFQSSQAVPEVPPGEASLKADNT